MKNINWDFFFPSESSLPAHSRMHPVLKICSRVYSRIQLRVFLWIDCFLFFTITDKVASNFHAQASPSSFFSSEFWGGLQNVATACELSVCLSVCLVEHSKDCLPRALRAACFPPHSASSPPSFLLLPQIWPLPPGSQWVSASVWTGGQGARL